MPTRYESSEPLVKDWANYCPDSLESIERDFSHADINFGLLTGNPARDLHAIKPQCREAASAAQSLLPATATIHPAGEFGPTHLYFTSPYAGSGWFEDPTAPEDETLLDVWGNGGMVLVPPSVDADGQRIELDFEEIVTVDGRELWREVELAGTAGLLARHWLRGKRQALAGRLAEALLCGGWTIEEVNRLVSAVAEAAGDKKVLLRLDGVRKVAQQFERGRARGGFQGLRELLGNQLAECVYASLRIDLPADRSGLRRGAHGSDGSSR